MSVASNLADIRQDLDNKPVTLIAVTKYASIEQMEEAYKFGITEFGESRVQHALDKQKTVPPYINEGVKWHFIGHLQTNKVKKIVGKFDLIHSVDSLNLASEISKQAQSSGTVQRILIQVKIVSDPAKSGFSARELKNQFTEIMNMPNLKIEGLMTMCPNESGKDVWRECFIGLKQLRDELQTTHGVSLGELSMGMSDDWREAVACGSTMIRLGRAIFGETEACLQ